MLFRSKAPPTTVLVVDDLPGTRAVLRDMLDELGFLDIEEASSGREALVKALQKRPLLVVSDHSMK